MQDPNQRFVGALQEVDKLLSDMETGSINLKLSLKDVSKLHHLQKRLQDCKLLNSIYSDESRIKVLLNKQASTNLQLQDQFCQRIETNLQNFLHKFEVIDKLYLYVVNQIINQKSMLTILKQMGLVVFGTQVFTVMKMADRKLELTSTDSDLNLNEAQKQQLYDQLKGDSQQVWTHTLNAPFQKIFKLNEVQVIRSTNKQQSNSIIIFEKNPDAAIPILKPLQIKEIVDQIISITYDYTQGVYNKETLTCSVRAINQYLIKNTPALCQELIRTELDDTFSVKCEIIPSKKHSLDESYALTENISNAFIPVKSNTRVNFYIHVKNLAIEIITFTDFISQLWSRLLHQLRILKDKEFLQQIIEVSNPQKLVMAIDLDLNIIYQSGPIPSSWKFMELNGQKIDQFQNMASLKMEQVYRNMLLNCLEEIRATKKGALDAGQIIFFDKSVDIAVYVKKDENNEIAQYFLIFDPPKKRVEQPRQSKSDIKQSELAQEAISALRIDKLEKACYVLQEHLHLTLSIDDIVEFLKEKELIQEVEGMEQITEEIRQSYVLEYFREAAPTQYRRHTISDFSTPFQTKTLIQEQQLTNAKKLDVFSLRPDDYEQLQEWSFDITKHKDDQIHYTWALFQLVNFLDQFQIPKDIFFNYLVIIEEKYNYRQNPFHNFEHGFTVAHAAYYMIKNKLLDDLFDNIEQFSMLLACLCHDVDHTGRTNGFEVARMSKLAIRYNDDSVLENHHVSTVFKLLQKDKYNILTNLSQEQYQVVRKFVVSNILSTDMKKHFELIKQADLRIKVDEPFTILKDEDKKLVAGLLVHACDLTQPTKSFSISRNWSLRIQSEFDNQVEEERLLQFPITQHLICQNLPKQELSFIRAIVKPLYDMANMICLKGLIVALENIDNNQKQWELQLQR